MFELLLFRHAKSRWDIQGLEDHDRELAPRGEKAAAAMGKLLKKKKWLPDLVLCSTAVRARQTLEIAAKKWPDDIEFRWLGSIYGAAPWRLNDIARRQSTNPQRMMLVGHSPGMESYAVRLIGRGSKKDRAKLEEKFPTGSLVRIGFDMDGWSEILPEKGRLLDFVRPRDLK